MSEASNREGFPSIPSILIAGEHPAANLVQVIKNGVPVHDEYYIQVDCKKGEGIRYVDPAEFEDDERKTEIVKAHFTFEWQETTTIDEAIAASRYRKYDPKDDNKRFVRGED